MNDRSLANRCAAGLRRHVGEVAISPIVSSRIAPHIVQPSPLTAVNTLSIRWTNAHAGSRWATTPIQCLFGRENSTMLNIDDPKVQEACFHVLRHLVLGSDVEQRQLAREILLAAIEFICRPTETNGDGTDGKGRREE